MIVGLLCLFQLLPRNSVHHETVCALNKLCLNFVKTEKKTFVIISYHQH